MKKTITYLALLTCSLLLNRYISFAHSTQTNTDRYQCPMKCEGEKTYDKPGKSPVCGMSLRKISPPVVSETAAVKKNKVRITGSMMKVMRQGELTGTIDVDTILNKEHLYGLGPVEYLKGEILIMDGRSYKSSVEPDGSIQVEETFTAKAPFFVYANIEKWKDISLPDSVQTIPQLESFLDLSTKNHSRPFAFLLTAKMEKGELHVVNLPAGTAVHSPEDVHLNQLTYKLKKQSAELVGFFSTTHQGIFTHHDSFVHIHLITTDKKKMGHLETMMIKKGTAKLYIPAE